MKQRDLLCLSMALLALASVPALVYAGAAYCTRETCPAGVVEVYFEENDCSGDYYFYVPYLPGLDGCISGRKSEARDEGLYRWDFYGSDQNPSPAYENCDETHVNATYSLRIDKWATCVGSLDRKRSLNSLNSGAGSTKVRAIDGSKAGRMMYLKNVNDSFPLNTPAFVADPNVPEYDSTYDSCEGPDNCPTGVQIWTTQYSDYPECHTKTFSNAYTGQTQNCVNYDDYYYRKDGCFDENGEYSAYYLDSQCTQVAYLSATRRVCSADSATTTHCNAPITQLPIAPATPASSATAMHASIVIVVAAILLALF